MGSGWECKRSTFFFRLHRNVSARLGLERIINVPDMDVLLASDRGFRPTQNLDEHFIDEVSSCIRFAYRAFADQKGGELFTNSFESFECRIWISHHSLRVTRNGINSW